MEHDSSSAISLKLRYRVRGEFQTVYEFGRVTSNEEMFLMLPSTFAPYSVSSSRDALQCEYTFSGDWLADGDKIMVQMTDCTSDGSVSGFPETCISDERINGMFRFGSPTGTTAITADASGSGDPEICFCDAGHPSKDCSFTTDYTFMVAELHIEGPYEEQVFYSWRGAALGLRRRSVVW